MTIEAPPIYGHRCAACQDAGCDACITHVSCSACHELDPKLVRAKCAGCDRWTLTCVACINDRRSHCKAPVVYPTPVIGPRHPTVIAYDNRVEAERRARAEQLSLTPEPKASR